MSELPAWESGPDGLLAYFGITTGCCVSCAEDSNMGYYICSVDLPDGREVEVCCTHAGELRERIEAIGDPTDLPLADKDVAQK